MPQRRFKPTWKRFERWNHWKAVSQVLRCSLIAMKTEASRVGKAKAHVGTLEFNSGLSTFTVSAQQYVKCLHDEHLVCSMVLQAYFGLLEQHARDVLLELHNVGVDISQLIGRTQVETLEDKLEYYPPSDGIEVWGTSLLKLVNRGWEDVKLGKEIIVAAAVIRIALAHGTPKVTQRMLNRLKAAGASIPWGRGKLIKLNYDLVKDYRDGLRSFARVISDATAQVLESHASPTPNASRKRRKRAVSGTSGK